MRVGVFVFKCHAWHDCRRARAHTQIHRHTRTQTHQDTHTHQDTRTRFFFHMPLWPHGALYIPRTLPSTLCCSITPKTNNPIQETPAIVKSLGLLGPIQAYNNHFPHGLLAQYKEGLRTGVRSTVIHDLKKEKKKLIEFSFFSFSDLLRHIVLFPVFFGEIFHRFAFLWFCVVS